MLRFLPDSWLEGLLRPFLLIDPIAGLYLELSAPDWRFALCVVLLAAALATRQARQRIGVEQARLVIALAVLLYVWTFVSGNGRYFVVGMLLVGPVLVLACRLLPGSRALRNLVLAAVMGLQGFTLLQNFSPGAWTLVPWRGGPGLEIEASPLRQQPAVFLTVTGISMSALVPVFHPASRWANLAGQHEIRPGSREAARLAALLSSPLPKVLLLPTRATWVAPERLSAAERLAMFDNTLAAQGLALAAAPCRLLRSPLGGAPAELARPAHAPPAGLWACDVQSFGLPRPPGTLPAGSALAEVFARIEQRCPRFFPPGEGRDRVFAGTTERQYTSSDVRLNIDDKDLVRYMYFRATEPTLIGTATQVRDGNFMLACDKLPGRYRMPWQRD